MRVRSAGLAVALCLLSVGFAVAAIKGTTSKVAGTVYLSRYACPPSGRCVAIGQSTRNAQNFLFGVVVPVSGGKPGAAVLVKSASGLRGLACPLANFCLAVGASSNGSGGVVVPIANGIPGVASVVAGTGDLNSIGCAGGSSCWATGFDASGKNPVVVNINGSGDTVRSFKGHYTYLFTGGESGGAPLFCAPSKACIALGSQNLTSGPGVVVSLADGKLASVRRVAGTTDLGGLACSTAKSCVATGYQQKGSTEQGIVLSILNGKPGPVHRPSGVTYIGAVACKSASRCYAFGLKKSRPVVIPISNGKPGTPQTAAIIGNGDWCGRSGCVAVGVEIKKAEGAIYPFR